MQTRLLSVVFNHFLIILISTSTSLYHFYLTLHLLTEAANGIEVLATESLAQIQSITPFCHAFFNYPQFSS